MGLAPRARPTLRNQIPDEAVIAISAIERASHSHQPAVRATPDHSAERDFRSRASTNRAMPTMRCLLIARHGRPSGAEQPVLAPSLLRCDSFAFRARSGRAHFYNPNHDRRRPTARRQTSLDVEGPGTRRARSRVLDRCPDGHACILAAFPRAPRIRSTGLADGRRTASRPPDGPAGVGRQVGREPLDALRKVGRDERHHEEHRGEHRQAGRDPAEQGAQRQADDGDDRQVQLAITGFRP